MTNIICLILFLFACLWSILALDRPCARRIINNDPTRIVCVCNATYCDDVDPIGILSTNGAAIYASSLSGKRLDRSDVQWSSGRKVDDKSSCKRFD